MLDDELIQRLNHFANLSYGNPICKDAANRIQDLKNDVRFYQAKLKQIQENTSTYNWKETVSLPDRLRAMASMMNAGAAWGFCGESLFLEQAADLLEGKNKT